VFAMPRGFFCTAASSNICKHVRGEYVSTSLCRVGKSCTRTRSFAFRYLSELGLERWRSSSDSNAGSLASGVAVERNIWSARDGASTVHLFGVMGGSKIAMRELRTWEVESGIGCERYSGIGEHVSGVDAVDDGDEWQLEVEDRVSESFSRFDCHSRALKVDWLNARLSSEEPDLVFEAKWCGSGSVGDECNAL
jgi:hypothetical protein